MTDPESTAAVLPDFADAQGLEQLLAGARVPGVSRPATESPSGPTPTPPPVLKWPPPPTPEPFKLPFRQFDQMASALAGVAPEDEKLVDAVADSWWPLAHYYGFASDRPSVGMLWAYAAISLLGVIALKVQKVQQAQADAAERAQRDHARTGTT